MTLKAFTRYPGGRAPFNYELRSCDTGGVLQASDELGMLMRYVEEKKNVTIVRTRDERVLWPVATTETP